MECVVVLDLVGYSKINLYLLDLDIINRSMCKLLIKNVFIYLLNC